MLRFYLRLFINFSSSILHRFGEVVNQMPDKEKLSHLFETPFQRTPIWERNRKTIKLKRKIKISASPKGAKHSEQKTFNHPH